MHALFVGGGAMRSNICFEFARRYLLTVAPEYAAPGRIALAVHRCVAFHSVASGLHPRSQRPMTSLPNKSLEPTPVTLAPFLRVGSGAVQLNRRADQ
jgi:hypothetical protein